MGPTASVETPTGQIKTSVLFSVVAASTAIFCRSTLFENKERPSTRSRHKVTSQSVVSVGHFANTSLNTTWDVTLAGEEKKREREREKEKRGEKREREEEILGEEGEARSFAKRLGAIILNNARDSVALFIDAMPECRPVSLAAVSSKGISS